MNTIFVDAAGWLAYLDENHPLHADAQKSILKYAGSIITSDLELLHLSTLVRILNIPINKEQVASLIWNLWEGDFGNVIRVSDEDQSIAWEVYLKITEPDITFIDCLNSFLISKLKAIRFSL